MYKLQRNYRRIRLSNSLGIAASERWKRSRKSHNKMQIVLKREFHRYGEQRKFCKALSKFPESASQLYFQISLKTRWSLTLLTTVARLNQSWRLTVVELSRSTFHQEFETNLQDFTKISCDTFLYILRWAGQPRVSNQRASLTILILWKRLDVQTIKVCEPSISFEILYEFSLSMFQEWTDYDEKISETVSIFEVESKFQRA